ncbi:MAG: hypothetical protein ABI202_07865 [Candidatus Baltobacteraceae bacterium]
MTVYGDGYTEGTGKVEVFPLDAREDVQPERVLTGPQTLLSSPGDFAWDAQGNLYVIDAGFFSSSRQLVPQRVLVFAPGASGNVAPIRVIAGSKTGFNGFGSGIAVDHSGDVFVAQSVDCSVPIFAPGARGNVAPIAVLPVGCGFGPTDAFDTGRTVYVTGGQQGQVDAYIQASATSWLLDRTINVTGAATYIDVRGGDAYVSEGPFPHGFIGVYPVTNFRLIRTLSLPSPRFTTPRGVTVDREGTVYAAAQTHRNKPWAIAIFLRGRMHPSAYIEGPQTGLGITPGLRVGP